MKKIWILVALLALLIGAIYLLTQQLPPITKTVEVTLSVKPAPDFILAVDPAHIDSPVGRVVAYGATVTAANNFVGQVVFSVSGLPAGFTVTYFPSDTVTLDSIAPKSVQINIDIANDPALVADYTITVKAESTNYN